MVDKKKALTIPKTAIQQLAIRLSVTPEILQSTLKATAFKECKTNEQFVAAVMIANTYRLNPILKEMTAFPSKGGSVVPIVMIDGFISMVNRQNDFDGVELIENEDEDAIAKVGSVTAKFYLKSKTHPVVITEYMAECYNENKEPWKRWPRRMLRHKAYIQGARIAFGFSGIYDHDEAERIVEAEIVGKTGKPEVKEPQALPAGENSSPYKKMLEAFEISKGIMGDEKYYAILNKHDFKHANEIKKVDKGNEILSEMRSSVDVEAQ